jgi:hypothetical protein
MTFRPNVLEYGLYESEILCRVIWKVWKLGLVCKAIRDPKGEESANKDTAYGGKGDVIRSYRNPLRKEQGTYHVLRSLCKLIQW